MLAEYIVRFGLLIGETKQKVAEANTDILLEMGV